MANEEFVSEIKNIHKLVRAGNLEEAYLAYRDLFTTPAFATHRPEDQRQALKMMIYAKGVPSSPTPEILEAHRAAVTPLEELVSYYNEPSDYEMLGICHKMLGNVASADTAFRSGLTIERERNPQSDLCGSLMKRISSL